MSMNGSLLHRLVILLRRLRRRMPRRRGSSASRARASSSSRLNARRRCGASARASSTGRPPEYMPGSVIEWVTSVHARDHDVVARCVRCPTIPTTPPIMQRLPMRVLPDDARAAGDRRVRADAHVVPDLDLVVELDAVFDDGVVDARRGRWWCWRRSRRRRRCARCRAAAPSPSARAVGREAETVARRSRRPDARGSARRAPRHGTA